MSNTGSGIGSPLLSSVEDVFSDDEDENNIDVKYAPGRHNHVPSFDYDDELNGSEYTSQMEALYWMLHGDNVVLCGQAGSGKSWVVDRYRDIVNSFNDRLKLNNRKFEMAMTASTGAAASIIFGKTIHSWAGLGISVDRFDESKMTNIQRRVWKKAAARIKSTDVLVIDEVSMLPAYFLSNLDLACKTARRKFDAPFGGLQVILVGDFLQLPPVDKHELDRDGNEIDCRYCFRARDENDHKIITPSNFRFCYLDRSRRSGDNRLNDLLNGMRNNEDIGLLRSMIAPRFNVKQDPDKTYTRLRTVNKSVDYYNQERLNKLQGELHRYPLKREGDKDACKELISNGNLKTLELKVGAAVMISSNQAYIGYVNGSMGKIVELNEGMSPDGKRYPVIKVKMNRLPVDVVTTEGMTKDHIDELKTIDINYINVEKTHNELQKVYNEEDDSYELKEVEVIDARVKYVPLRLAWAITVHKSQGQTLDGVVINMDSCFQPGLGYVAMSRCRSIDDIVMEGELNDLPDNVFRVDLDAQRADKSVRKHAIESHTEFLEVQKRAKDYEAMLLGASSKTARRRIERKAGPDIGYEELFRDDESCYEYVERVRSKINRSRR